MTPFALCEGVLYLTYEELKLYAITPNQVYPRSSLYLTYEELKRFSQLTWFSSIFLLYLTYEELKQGIRSMLPVYLLQVLYLTYEELKPCILTELV